MKVFPNECVHVFALSDYHSVHKTTHGNTTNTVSMKVLPNMCLWLCKPCPTITSLLEIPTGILTQPLWKSYQMWMMDVEKYGRLTHMHSNTHTSINFPLVSLSHQVQWHQHQDPDQMRSVLHALPPQPPAAEERHHRDPKTEAAWFRGERSVSPGFCVLMWVKNE